MYTDLMLDMEFLSQREDAVITQISAIPFDISNGFYDGMEEGTPNTLFHAIPSLEDQLLCRSIDEHTLLGWMNQIAQNGSLPIWADESTGTLDDSVEELYAWGMENLDWEVIRIWAHVGCDMTKLEHAVTMAGMDRWWPWGNIEHLPTLRRLAYHKGTEANRAVLDDLRDEITHDAVYDCVAQIKIAHMCWEIIYGL